MMLSDTQKGIIVALLSLIISALVVGGGYEWYQGRKYDQWKAGYEESGDWYGKLTIPSDNETMMWEYRAHGHFENLHTNGFGFRDEDYPTTARPDGTYRVAFIGDSITLGLEVDYADIFVRRFDAWASKDLPGKQVQALNFGIDGYNTLQIQALLAARVLAYEPNQVVYVMCLNDFDFEDASGQKIKYFRKPESFLLARVERLHKRWRDKNYYQYHFDKNRDQVFAAIAAMKQLLEQRGIDFQVALLPIFPMNQQNFDNYPQAVIHAQILTFLGQNAIPVIDLLAGIKASNGAPEQYAYDEWHPNEKGHQAIAEQLRVILDTNAGPGRH